MNAHPGAIAAGATVLDTWFPVPNRMENFGSAAILADVVGHLGGSKSYRLNLAELDRALAAFAPFANDAKRHANVTALSQMRATQRRGHVHRRPRPSASRCPRRVLALGKGSLLGANSGCGIPLGDGCTVEAGLYITAGTKCILSDGRVVKARELAGTDDLLFRRNSIKGYVEVLETKNEVELNP